MKIENTVKIMKEIHKDKVILVKIGSFYNCYGKDSIIIAYLFNYNLKKVDNCYTYGFPIGSINKILMNLENKKISYMIVDKSDNYEKIEDEDFETKNKYNELYNIAHKYMNRKNRINEIYNYLIENINEDSIKEKILKIEEFLYEV